VACNCGKCKDCKAAAKKKKKLKEVDARLERHMDRRAKGDEDEEKKDDGKCAEGSNI
jgi:hypothetical protein